MEEPGDNDDTYNDAQQGEMSIIHLRVKEISQEGEHKYYILEGAGNNSDTNTDVQNGKHEYHVLDGEKLEGEEGEEQG